MIRVMFSLFVLNGSVSLHSLTVQTKAEFREE